MLVVLDRNDEHRPQERAEPQRTCTCSPFDQLNAYDVLVSDDIVFTKGAFDAFVAGPVTAAQGKQEKDEVSA